MNEEDIKKELEEIKEQLEENTKITKKLYSRMRVATIFSAIKYTIYVLIAAGVLYYAQPYIDQTIKTYKAIIEGVDNLNNFKENQSSKLDSALESINKYLDTSR